METERKVILCYKQREGKPDIFVESYGSRILVSQSGTVDYEQKEVVSSANVEKRIKELKSFRNRNYHSFTVN